MTKEPIEKMNSPEMDFNYTGNAKFLARFSFYNTDYRFIIDPYIIFRSGAVWY